MKGYWKRPKLWRYDDGGHLNLGPVQFNWGFNGGLRIYLTWPGRTRTAHARKS